MVMIVETKNVKQDEDANHYISDVVVGAKTG
jgi:ribosomal protein L35AE/L33A